MARGPLTFARVRVCACVVFSFVVYSNDPKMPKYQPNHPVDGGLPQGYEFQNQVDSIVQYV